MNVGVFLGNVSPEVGGGYTFQWDVLQALVELAEESRHQFVVFGGGKHLEATQPALKTGRLQFKSYRPPGLVERGASRIGLDLPVFRKVWRRPNGLERTARETGVEFMWFVDAQPVQLDLPYLAPVWDLQHRLQPWFPEVSYAGEWDGREVHYSRFLRRATVIISGTETGREEIMRFYQLPSERIKLLPHPTPGFALNSPPGGEQEVLDKYGIPNNYLFYPAQFWAHKNHVNLLLAVRKLRDDYKLSLPVVFVGSDKGNQEYIRRYVNELDLSQQVHFLGFVSIADLIALYRNAFALAYVTFFGPENLPPLEAFALGCPVVASNVPGAQEQLGECALLVDPKSPAQIAQAVKSLYEDLELRRTLVERGLKRASSWTGNDFVRGVFSILDEFEPSRRCWGK